jgi:folate-binding protein YgfZ
MSAAPRAIRLARRGVVRVAGPDAASFLDGLLTIDVARARPDAPAPAALLTPQGKILYELVVHAAEPGSAEPGFEIELARQGVEDLLKRLTLYRLRADVEIADRSEDRAVLVAADGRARRIGAADEGEDAPATYDAWRVGEARPEQGPDYGAGEVFPADVNLDLLGGVDYAKGCFVGQEVVSRMKRRGSIRKRTLVMTVEGAPPPKGAEIVAGDLRLGEALSSAGGKALALVRLDRLAAAAPADIRVQGRPVRIAFPAWFPEDARRVGGEDAA